jgi:hypothetical protein
MFVGSIKGVKNFFPKRSDCSITGEESELKTNRHNRPIQKSELDINRLYHPIQTEDQIGIRRLINQTFRPPLVINDNLTEFISIFSIYTYYVCRVYKRGKKFLSKTIGLQYYWRS